MYLNLALIIFFFVPVLLVILRNILFETYFWQIKEYRLDRVFSTIRYRESKPLRNSYINLIQVGLLIASLIFLISPNNSLLLVPALVFLSYVVEFMITLDEIAGRRLIRPKKSIRNLLILVGSLFLSIIPIVLFSLFLSSLYSKNDIINEKEDTSTPVTIEDLLVREDLTNDAGETIPLSIAVLFIVSVIGLSVDLLSPLIVSILALATEPLAQYKRRKTIARARALLRRNKDVKIVAITGSYGKTTTKELLYEVLKDNFKTAKTDKNFNSTVGVAESILRNLKTNTEVFIAEMGAYKKGEIKASTRLAPPDISIVTSIGPQHVSLFGSMEKLVKAKFEIIQGLKENGLAIFNGNNEYCVQMAGKTENPKLFYFMAEGGNGKVTSTQKELPSTDHEALFALNIEEKDGEFRFDLKYKNHSHPVKLKLNGLHNISNLLAAVGAAMSLGMDVKDIVAKLNTIELPTVHLREFDGINNTLVVDDSYNTNSEGFKAALKYISKKPGKKIVVTRGILELGNLQIGVYEELAKHIQEVADLVITSDEKLIDVIKVNTEGVETLYAYKAPEFYKHILNNTHEDDVILLEGRLAPDLVDTIIDTN